MQEKMKRALAGVDVTILSRPQRMALILPLLQRVQREFGYLPKEAFVHLSRLLGIPESRLHGIATFYSHFRLTPPGENQITVCCGTACHVRGSAQLLQNLRQRLGIGARETTPDRKFSLDTIACFGSCALAPVVVFNGKVQGRMNRTRLLKKVDALADKTPPTASGSGQEDAQ